MTNDNVIYLADRRDPWLKGDDVRYVDDYRDLWIAVLRTTMEDYWRGQRQGQDARFLSEEPLEFRSRHDAECYRNWYFAAHWLLSDSTEPRSCRWLLKLLGLEHQAVVDRMISPPVRTRVQIEEETTDD